MALRVALIDRQDELRPGTMIVDKN